MEVPQSHQPSSTRSVVTSGVNDEENEKENDYNDSKTATNTEGELGIDFKGLILREQIKNLSVDLRESESILWYLTGYELKTSTNKLLIKIFIIWCIIFILDQAVSQNVNDSIGIYFRIVAALLLAVGSALFGSFSNYFVFRAAIGTFTVWYKTIFGILSIISREMYYNRLIIRTNTSHIAVRIIYVILQNIPPFFGLLSVCILDGYASKGDKQIIKKFAIIMGFILFTLSYIEIYIDFYGWAEESGGENNKITFFGDDRYTVTWRSIALTSNSTTMFFYAAQLYAHLKRPKKINAFPIYPRITKMHLILVNKQNTFNDNNTQEQLQVNSRVTVRSHRKHFLKKKDGVRSDSKMTVFNNLDFKVNIASEQTIFYMILYKYLTSKSEYDIETVYKQCSKISQMLLSVKYNSIFLGVLVILVIFRAIGMYYFVNYILNNIIIVNFVWFDFIML